MNSNIPTQFEPTITALATSMQPAGVAVVRVSGSKAFAIADKVFKSKDCPTANIKTVCYGKLVNPDNNQIIDKCLCFAMQSPNSFTGEDVVEFHIHGGTSIIQKTLSLLYINGANPAEAGEFTKRAFLNGKLNLTQAEAVCDLVSADSERALKIAQEQISGRLSSALSFIAEPMRDVLAQIEAFIDFPEEDIEPDALEKLKNQLVIAKQKVDQLVASYSYGKIAKGGVRVLLCGPPNAGKSSILNALVGESRAIVTDVQGTTRDLIEESSLISGQKFVFCDSAGIRETECEVERIGIELTRSRFTWADIIICIVDLSTVVRDGKLDIEKLEALYGMIGAGHSNVWLVLNKVDIEQKIKLEVADLNKLLNGKMSFNKYLVSSAVTENGLDILKSELLSFATEKSGVNESETGVVVTNERHKTTLEKSSSNISRAIKNIEINTPREIISEDIRSALTNLDEIVGKTYNEDILGRIFSKFCIGK